MIDQLEQTKQMPNQTTASQPTGSSRTHLVFGILLSGFMATIFAGLMSFLALGLTAEWLKAWAAGIVIGWPLGLAIVSLIQRPLMRLAMRLTR